MKGKWAKAIIQDKRKMNKDQSASSNKMDVSYLDWEFRMIFLICKCRGSLIPDPRLGVGGGRD